MERDEQFGSIGIRGRSFDEPGAEQEFAVLSASIEAIREAVRAVIREIGPGAPDAERRGRD